MRRSQAAFQPFESEARGASPGAVGVAGRRPEEPRRCGGRLREFARADETDDRIGRPPDHRRPARRRRSRRACRSRRRPRPAALLEGRVARLGQGVRGDPVAQEHLDDSWVELRVGRTSSVSPRTTPATSRRVSITESVRDPPGPGQESSRPPRLRFIISMRWVHPFTRRRREAPMAGDGETSIARWVGDRKAVGRGGARTAMSGRSAGRGR
jgi:hypothetical protein